MKVYVNRGTTPKKRAAITPALRLLILGLLREHSQQQVARRLGISQAAVNRVAIAKRDTSDMPIYA